MTAGGPPALVRVLPPDDFTADGGLWHSHERRPGDQRGSGVPYVPYSVHAQAQTALQACLDASTVQEWKAATALVVAARRKAEELGIDPTGLNRPDPGTGARQ